MPETAAATSVVALADSHQQERSLAAIPAPALSLTLGDAPPLQPIQDVARYLEQRAAALHHSQERPLFLTLPESIRDNLATLLGDETGKGAFGLIDRLIKRPLNLSVARAAERAYTAFNICSALGISLKRFRTLYDQWAKDKDWVVLVNRSKAGIEWQDRDDGLQDITLTYFAKRLGQFKRADGKLQAWRSIERQWRTGRNLRGDEEMIPGYESGWTNRNREILPEGWSYSNVMRQLKARNAFSKPVQKLLQEGVAAAKELLPQVLSTRKDLRFLELVTFDDVRIDCLVFDPKTGQPCELWLLVARDQATAMVLGFVMHLRTSMENANTDPRAKKPERDSLGHREMKQLAAWLLERYPLPPYTCIWKIERGTATLSEGSALAIKEMLPSRITVSYTSMVGGTSSAGYREKKKGNSRGKASHESHNRLYQTQSSYLQGQTGAHYDIRPADLQARAEECVEIWKLRLRLPEHLRGQEEYPLLLPEQAREALFQMCIDQNFRKDHKLEGFEKVLEWFDPATRKWQPQSTYVAGSKVEFRTRMEMPVERAIKLMAPYAGQWTKASPDIIIAFLTHAVRSVPIKASGEIVFQFEGHPIIFRPPPGISLAGIESGLAYYAPDDPKFLHVTNGKGAVLGTWYRRDRVGWNEQELLEQAMRYTANALKAAQEMANQLNADERERLDTMRLHNANLERGTQFIDVTHVQLPAVKPGVEQLESRVATALASHPRTRSDQQRTRAADEALAASLDAV